MATQLSVFIATSLDGFIAREDGSIDWLQRANAVVPKGEDALTKTVSGTNDSPTQIAATVEREGAKRAYIDGGITIQRFLNDGLIDDLTITRVPVLLGRGLPLFGPLAGDVELTHVTTKSWDFGFVQSVYRVVRATAIR